MDEKILFFGLNNKVISELENYHKITVQKMIYSYAS